MLTLKISAGGGAYAPHARVFSLEEIALDIFRCEQKNIKWLVVDDNNHIVHMSFSNLGSMNDMAQHEKKIWV
jgi:hypothetical protein